MTIVEHGTGRYYEAIHGQHPAGLLPRCHHTYPVHSIDHLATLPRKSTAVTRRGSTSCTSSDLDQVYSTKYFPRSTGRTSVRLFMVFASFMNTKYLHSRFAVLMKQFSTSL